MEKRRKRQEEGGNRKTVDLEDDDDEWPSMPPGCRILTPQEQEQQRQEEELRKQTEMTATPTATEILNDLRKEASENQLSSLPQETTEEPAESGDVSESLLTAFEDISSSPPTCSIVVDTLPEDDDLLYPGTSL